VKFVLLLPVASPQLSLSRHFAHGQKSAPNEKPPIICLQGVHKAAVAMWLDKATMSTGNNNITGLHVVQRPQDRGAKYFSITCPFPTTLIHMHPFISSAVDTPLGIRRRVYLQDEQAKRLLHAKSIPRGRLSLYSRDPEAKKNAKKPSLFT
jgi:hypothetical protein